MPAPSITGLPSIASTRKGLSTQKARHHEKADKPRLLEKDLEIEAHQLEARELPHVLQGQAQAVCCSCWRPLVDRNTSHTNVTLAEDAPPSLQR